MTKLYADIILFDTVGSPYTGKTLSESGMGGSEFQSILLLETLVKHGYKIICLNNTKDQIEHNGVLYLSHNNVHKFEFQCNNLIIHRSSAIPKIQHKKCFVWSTDLNGPHNLHFYELFEQNKMQLITLSKFHDGQFPSNWNKSVINFMIPDWIYNYPIPTNKKNYVYASSLMKGWGPTFSYWDYLKSNKYIDSDEILNVCLPGYDNKSILIYNNKINYLGTLTLEKVVETIASCKSMFYVNMMPETFCISAVLAEILKTTPLIYCLNGTGALQEVLNTQTVTTDMHQFINYFKIGTPTPSNPSNYKIDTVIENWKSILIK
jgi:hypothetical protein